LSNKRALIISRNNLNEIGKEMLDDKLLIHSVKIISHNMYGNYLEAIIGALYLDKGIKKTEKFIKKQIIDRPRINKNINFIVLESSGPDHKKKYNIGFLLNGDLIENQWSNSVKEGEQVLAKKIYEEIDERNTFTRKDR
jgi:ribonuclease-3